MLFPKKAVGLFTIVLFVLTEYTEADKNKHGDEDKYMYERYPGSKVLNIILIVLLSLCVPMVLGFVCCFLKLICCSTNQEYDLANGNSPSIIVRSGIASHLSAFQRRAVLEWIFGDKSVTIADMKNNDTPDKVGSKIDADVENPITGNLDLSDREGSIIDPIGSAPQTPVTPKTETSFQSTELNLDTTFGDGRSTLFPIPATTLNESSSPLSLSPSRSQQDGGVNESPDEVICPICLDDYGEGNNIIKSKHCSHFFHKECILTWLEKHEECPCCREHMITPEEVHAAVSVVVGPQRMINVVSQNSRIYRTPPPSPQRPSNRRNQRQGGGLSFASSIRRLVPPSPPMEPVQIEDIPNVEPLQVETVSNP